MISSNVVNCLKISKNVSKVGTFPHYQQIYTQKYDFQSKKQGFYPLFIHICHITSVFLGFKFLNPTYYFTASIYNCICKSIERKTYELFFQFVYWQKTECCTGNRLSGYRQYAERYFNRQTCGHRLTGNHV